jgi:hypothetical protein
MPGRPNAHNHKDELINPLYTPMNFSPNPSLRHRATAGLLTAAIVLTAGCGDNQTRQSADAPAPLDHEAEAKKTINAENMDRVLADLEAEIAADEATAP